MAEKRRPSKKNRRDEEDEKPTKEEYAVAKYVRFNCPVRDSKLERGLPVKSFVASEAVNLLLDSKWATKGKSDALFTNRQSVVNYMDRLLMKRLFHRAIRVEKKKKKVKDEDESTSITNGEEEKEKKLRRRGKKDKDAETESKEKETDKKEKDSDKKDEKKKKEKKLKLKMTDDQVFMDGDEIYVWVYDPVPLKTFLIGLLLVLGSIGVCLFPLWPPEVRRGVYYLSLSAIGFIGLFLFLVAVRFVLFCCVWLASLGKHHFWFLPNLTEDVGFMDSFRPLYMHELRTAKTESTEIDEQKKNDTVTPDDDIKKEADVEPSSKKSTEKVTRGKKSKKSSKVIAKEENTTEDLEEEIEKDKESDLDDRSTGSEDYEMVEKSDVTDVTDAGEETNEETTSS